MFCMLQLLRTKDIPRGCVALWTTTPQMTSWDRMAKLMREQCSLQSHVRDDKFKLTSLCHMNNSLVLEMMPAVSWKKYASVVSPNWLTWIRNVLTRKRAVNRLINQNNNKIWNKFYLNFSLILFAI